MAQTNWVPSAKVAGGTAAGAATTILLWLLEHFAHLQLPGAVASSVGVLIAVGTAYWIPGAKTPPVDERPLTDDERQQVVDAYDWFSQRDKNGG